MRKIIAWIAVFLWMAVIFFLSHQQASESSELSLGITEWIVRMVDYMFPNMAFDIESFHHFVRKAAHFVAYLILGIFVINAFRNSGVAGYRGMGLAFFICVLYAISDEAHQMFVPGRGPHVKDIVIDSLGASVGIGMFVLLGRFKRKNRLKGKN